MAVIMKLAEPVRGSGGGASTQSGTTAPKR